MTWDQIRDLHDDGFEIGNHTLNHRRVDRMTTEELKEELRLLDERCAQYGIPAPESFAYPGGPHTKEAAETVCSCGFKNARSLEKRAYRPGRDDPMTIPGIPVNGDDSEVFYNALELAGEGSVPVLIFHGIPDYEHPRCGTPPERFMEYMKYLDENEYSVIAMRNLALLEK